MLNLVPRGPFCHALEKSGSPSLTKRIAASGNEIGCLLRCLAQEPLRLRSEVLRSFIARHYFLLSVKNTKYSFKGNVISSRWPIFSFRHFEHLARLLKGDQAFLCKVINKEGILYFALARFILLILCVLLEKLRCGESIACETRHLYQLYLH